MPLLMLKDLPRYECLLGASRSFPALDPSACEAFLHLLRAGDEAYRQMEDFFTAYNMTLGRFTVLMLLSEGLEGGSLPQTPAELAEKAGVTRATITGLVDTLERDGLVTREHDSDDRRMMRVHITHKGQAAVREILPGHFRRMAALMAPLAEGERKALVRLLEKVAGQASRMAPGGRAHQPVETA